MKDLRKQRKRIALQMISVVLAMTACGGRQNPEAGSSLPESMESYEAEISSSPESTQPEEEGGADDNTPEPEQSFLVSDVEAVIEYEGGDFRKSVFCTGADMLYLYGTKPDESYFLGCMKQEDTQFYEIPLTLPEDMRVAYMTVDGAGNCHIMWISVEASDVDGVTHYRRTYEKAQMTVVDQEGELKAEIDLSEIFQTEDPRPDYACFAVDHEGNYYLGAAQEIIKLNGKGETEARIPCEGILQAVGCGRSGSIYCIYAEEDGGEYLGRVEQGEDAPKVAACGVSLPSAAALYLNMAAGADAELLFYNKAGGVYAYDADAGIAQRRGAPEEIPVSGMDVSGYGFLGDGRLCLLTTEDGRAVFYYVPTGTKSAASDNPGQGAFTGERSAGNEA